MDRAALPRIVTSIFVLAVIGGSVWVLSGSPLPGTASSVPAPEMVAVITTNLPDEAGRPTLARPGHLAPNFEWLEPDGSVVRLSDLRGRVVLMNYWATWCPPCRAEMPALQRVAQEEPDVVFLMVNLQEEEDQVVRFMERLELHDLKPVMDLNGQTARRYALASLPQTFFIDTEGLIRHFEIGGPISEETIREGIALARR